MFQEQFLVGTLLIVKDNIVLGEEDVVSSMVCLGWIISDYIEHVIVLHDKLVKKFSWEMGTLYHIGEYYEHDESYDVVDVIRPA